MKGIVLNISTPFDVYYFINLKKYVLDDYGVDLICIVAYSKQMEGLHSYLEKISRNITYINAKKCRYFNPNIFNNIRNIINLLTLCSKYKNYFLLSLDKSTLISNILLSNFEKKALLQHPTADGGSIYKRKYFLSFYCNIYNYIFKLDKVVVRQTDKREIEREIKPINAIRDIIYIEKSNNKKFITFPSSEVKDGCEVIIFGSRFCDWKHSSKALIDEILNFYTNLKNLYPLLDYVYIPHPRESKKEIKLLQNIFKGRLIEKDSSVPAELYLQQVDSNKFCISLGSTASRKAYIGGFRSYVFYKLIKLDPDICDLFDQIHSDLPREYFLYSMLDIQKKYTKTPITYGFFDDIHDKLTKG